MKQAKKLLCMLLVMLMAFSSISIGVSAAYTDYRSAPASYDTTFGDPILSTAQRSSQLLDYVDETLGSNPDLLIDITVMELDFRSVDKALDTIDDIKGLTGVIGGDVGDLNFDSLSGTRRGTAGKTDLDILYDLINFLNDNRGIVARFIRGELDLGIIKSFVDLDFNVYTMLLDMLYEMLIDETAAACPSGWTADSILQKFVDVMLVTGGTDKDGDPVEALLPSMSGKTNINTQSIWAIIENAANAATKDILVPLINDTLKPKIAEWKVDYSSSAIWDKLNIDNLNLATYTWGQYDSTNGIVAELNHFLYFVIDSVWTGDTFWADGGNDKLQDNVASLLKMLYRELGTDLLPASAEFLPVEEVEAMDIQQLCGYIGKQFLSAEMPDVYWEHMDGDYVEALSAEPDSIAQLAVYVMYSLTADINNINYLDDVYYAYGGEFTNEYAITMLADIGAYYLNAILPINAQYGEGVEALLKRIIDWALKDTNFGGFLKGCGITNADGVWASIDKTILKILPLQNILGGNIQGSEDLVMNHLVNAIFELDFEAILSLLYKSSSSLLNKTIPEAIVTIVNNVLNVIITRNTNATVLYNPTVTSVDTLIQNNNLAVSAERLLAGLKQCATYQYFWDSLLPILNPMLVDESVYVYNQANAPANYSVKTLDQLQAKIDEYDAILAMPDVYDTNPDNWNESEDFVLWRYDNIKEAMSDARDTVDGYNGAVQWVADAQVRIQTANEALAAANASGVQADIDAANAEVTAANAELAEANAEVASYTPAVYAEVAYAIEEAYNIAVSTKPEAVINNLMYVLDIANAKGYKKSDYKNQPEVWANYEKALDHAQAIYDSDVTEIKQSQVNEARKNLINAMRLLEVKLADIEALVNLIAQVKDTSLEGYSQETIDAFTAALADAQALAAELLSIDRQDDVDDMVARLQAAFEGLAADIIIPVLEALAGAKIDAENNFIAGIDTLTTVAELLANFIKTDENGTLDVETVNGATAVGTGSKVILKDKNGAEVATYEVVIYGDANGDGLVDIMDTICYDLYTVNDSNCNYANGSAQWTALNLDNSASVDAGDLIILDSYVNFEGEINQQNPFAA